VVGSKLPTVDFVEATKGRRPQGEHLPMNLDLGCGSRASDAVGIDISLNSLCSRHGMSVCGRGEHLPFADETFDCVDSFVALPYMNVPKAIQEVYRVLKPQGVFRAKVHPASFTLAEMKHSTQWRNIFYRMYVLVNGLALHMLSRNFRLPYRNRCESFQTRRGMERVMRRAGFEIEKSEWNTTIGWPHAGTCWVIGKKVAEETRVMAAQEKRQT